MTTKREALIGVLRERWPGHREVAGEMADHILASSLWPLVERAVVREYLASPRFRALVDEVFAMPGDFGPAKGYYGEATGHFIDLLAALDDR